MKNVVKYCHNNIENEEVCEIIVTIFNIIASETPDAPYCVRNSKGQTLYTKRTAFQTIYALKMRMD